MRLSSSVTKVPGRARPALILGTVIAVTAAMSPSTAAESARPAEPKKPSVSASAVANPNYDARGAGTTKSITTRAAKVAATPSEGVRELREKLGVQGVVDVDPLTRTPRVVHKVDGYLTGPSNKAPAAIARAYLRDHQDVFRLSPDEVQSLQLRKDYRDISGTHHLSFVQSVDGLTVFGNGLRAHVARDGRLIQVDGSPLAQTQESLARPTLSAAQARTAAVRDVHGRSKAAVESQAGGSSRTTTFKTGDQAELVAFQTSGGVRTAWQTITLEEGFLHVIDAASGRTLFRQNLVHADSGKVWGNYPGADRGGKAQPLSFTRPGWLPNNSPNLRGNVAHVWKDVNDDDVAQAGEEVRPSGRGNFNYPLTRFRPEACVPEFVCTWDPETAGSWQKNANQTAVQLFSFLGRFHDHLEAKPIGFTRAAGNFEAVDGDAVQGQAIDGATTDGAVPDSEHVDNANMLTPPDGTPPIMQMYLFHEPGTAFPDEDPFIAANSGDEADIVYHEYTHGLSNRLVVDANGVSTLGEIQAGAMGEAWGDWYAMDYLVNKGYFRDTPADGNLRIGEYVGWGNDLIRWQPIDCPVGSTSANCPGTPYSGPGGFTYGDFGHVNPGPEVHSDGEIWAATLWDLRKAIGSRLSESLVTRAMELSPPNPSFLDMRNAILLADEVVDKGKKQNRIWQVFAKRGMGYFAGAVDGDDPAPVEDFSMPPPANTPRGSLTGTVTNADTGDPAAGVPVVFGGHLNGFFGDYAAVSGTDGKYKIEGIVAGTYPKVWAGDGGYDREVRTVSIAARTNTENWDLRRDWAASAGGAEVVSFTPPDYTPFGCGPGSLIDQSQSSGWGSDAPGPREIVIELPETVDVAEVVINPSNTCGDDETASTGDYRLETSPDGTTWTEASEDHFTPADRKPTSVPLDPGSTDGVQFVRYTMLDSMVDDYGVNCATQPKSGCDFLDSTELAVYGQVSP